MDSSLLFMILILQYSTLGWQVLRGKLVADPRCRKALHPPEGVMIIASASI